MSRQWRHILATHSERTQGCSLLGVAVTLLMRRMSTRGERLPGEKQHADTRVPWEILREHSRGSLLCAGLSAGFWLPERQVIPTLPFQR